MQQSLSVNQEIPRILRNLDVHYRIHKSQSLCPVLSHLSLVQTPPSENQNESSISLG
jgi:hypothetical protein